MKNVVIILPTYNERDNISLLLDTIYKQCLRLSGVNFSILVVDDSSPDGTADIVSGFEQMYFPKIQLLKGKKQGLGAAYIRGFKYAMEKMEADVIFEMDADFSHNPKDIPRLLIEVLIGNDFVIGSRYTPGGSVPSNWPKLRKANSKWGNIFAKYIAGLKGVKDCTSGFRAINTEILRKIRLDKLNVKGYAFQISLLHAAIKKGAVVKEIPINFSDRVNGESKLKIGDISEFVLNTFVLRFQPFFPVASVLLVIALAYFLTKFFPSWFAFSFLSTANLLPLFIGFLAFILVLQGIFTLMWMLYAWEDPQDADRHKSPKCFTPPHLSYSALIPARNETRVIQDTILAISKINYPKHLTEALILCREDDHATIQKAQEVIDTYRMENVRVVTFGGEIINKPHSLNQGLRVAKNNIITVFDAEDEPHPDIYNVINTVMARDNADVVQSGVQLMNFRSHWFSALNVLEYFFWFKSGLNFFTRVGGITPLGGNTVFFKKELLKSIGGWDEQCLTEDADIGFRFTEAGAKTVTVYDEQHTTREETPSDISSFIKQRTRWNQGFLQIFLKGDWQYLPSLKQKIVALYILLSSTLQSLLLLYIPFALWVAFTKQLPVVVSLFSFIPLYILLLQIMVYVIGLYEFTKAYGLKLPLWMPLKLLVVFYPYQLILAYSTFRSMWRLLLGSNIWEKTLHTNAHRKIPVGLFTKGIYAKELA